MGLSHPSETQGEHSCLISPHSCINHSWKSSHVFVSLFQTLQLTLPSQWLKQLASLLFIGWMIQRQMISQRWTRNQPYPAAARCHCSNPLEHLCEVLPLQKLNPYASSLSLYILPSRHEIQWSAAHWLQLALIIVRYVYQKPARCYTGTSSPWKRVNIFFWFLVGSPGDTLPHRIRSSPENGVQTPSLHT